MDAALNVGEPWMWAAFIGFALAMLAVDLFPVGGNKAHKVGFREAAAWSFVWISLAMLFTLGLWWHLKGAYGSARIVGHRRPCHRHVHVRQPVGDPRAGQAGRI